MFDLAPVIVAMLKPLIWLAFFAVAAGVLKSPWFKGWWGERQVRDLIRRRLSPATYREFHNVTIRDEFGETTQIDHVYVSPFGVLVIETKHMGHWIFGGRHQPLWTQQIYRHKSRFQNPLRQNHRHIKVLEAALGLPQEAFKSVVVFTGHCTFKTEMPEEVCTLSDLIEYVHSIDERILDSEQVDAICRNLQRLRLEPSFRTHREHLDSLRRRHGSVSPLRSVPQRSSADSVVAFAAEQLAYAAEARLLHGPRRRATRAVGLGFGAALVKGVACVGAMFLIWWALMAGIRSAVRPLQATRVTAAPATVPEPLPVPTATQGVAVVVATAAQAPVYRHPTAEEIAERARRAEESLRVLERTTREVPFALPTSPPIGPGAQD